MNYTLRNLLVAAVLMLVGVLTVTSFIRSERKDLARGKQEVEVFIAAKDVPEGTPANELDADGLLERKTVLREDAPPNAVDSLKELGTLVSNQPIYAGEYVSLTAFDKTAGLKPTAQIKGNERLFTVPIQAASDVAGLIRPGDHVDLVATLPLGTNYFRHTVLARDVEVIETPTSLQPENQDVEEVAPEAEGDTKLYVFKATDREAQNVQFGLSTADQYGIFMLLRPANGSTESALESLVGPAPATIDAGKSAGSAASAVGPDPAIQ